MGRSQIVKDVAGIFKSSLYSEGDGKPLKGLNQEDDGIRLAVQIR